MEESDFLDWVTRIQALRDEHDSSSTSRNSNSVDDNEDAAQDLIAAFR